MILIKKLVVFGGTFNPPHIGHSTLAKSALNELDADKIIFMTAGNPPHKDESFVIDKNHRYEMVKLLAEEDECFECSDIEINSQEKSYTANTLSKLKVIYPECEIYFIVGLDSFYSIEKWYEPKRIFDSCILAVSLRGGLDDKYFDGKSKYYKEKYGAKIVKINMPPIEVSSSQIRELIKCKKPVNNLVNEKVFKYIVDNNLYEE